MQGEDFSVVLAKGGIYTPAEYDTDALQNDLVVDMFFNRQADQVMKYTVLTGVRDIVEVGSDLVEKAVSKRLGMEFDWKRCPLGLGYSNTHQHVLYSTKPWKTVEQFESIRETWETYTKNNKQCIKTLDDYKSFSDRVEAVALMDTPDGKYLRKKDGDLARLRQLLCSAWKHSAAGISQETSELSAREFAEFLTSCGIPCKKTDVENAKNRLFRPKTCPSTDVALLALSKVKEVHPTLDTDAFIYDGAISEDAVCIQTDYNCSFVARCT